MSKTFLIVAGFTNIIVGLLPPIDVLSLICFITGGLAILAAALID